jgi:5-methylcytosine-specific restriction enzyme subunit McrC
MSIWRIYDNHLTEVPGFQVEWLPPEAYSYLSPKISKSLLGTRVSLEAGPYVGSIPLENKDTLFIVPRYGRDAFSRMLLLSEGLADAIRDEFDELAAIGYQDDESIPWAMLLGHPFIDNLRLIEKQSLMAMRVEKHARMASARGRIQIIPTIRDLKTQLSHPVHSVFRVKTYDIPENRLLGYAAGVLLNLNTLDQSDSAFAFRWSRQLNRKTITQDELTQIVKGLRSGRYAGSRSYYVPGLLMARLIIAQAGVSLDDDNLIDALPVLTNVADLFEQYVRTVLSKAFSPLGYVVEKRQTNNPRLFVDGVAELKPDILISHLNGMALIADVKYKSGDTLPSSDYYQIFTYLERFGVDTAILILPGYLNESIVTSRQISSSTKTVYELRLPLDHWVDAEKSLIELVGKLLAI